MTTPIYVVQSRLATAPEYKPKAELTDAGNARRFVADHGNDARYVDAWGWCIWNGQVWRREKHLARRKMMETARAIHAEATQSTDLQEQKEIGAWARKSQSAQRVAGALWLAESELTASHEQFDQEHWLLPCANGAIDLRTGELHANRREHYATRVVPVCYSKSASAPTWEAFLKRVIPDEAQRAFLQRAAGYSLTGSTGEQCLFFLWGAGANGKSVFIETLASLLGEYHQAARIETLSQRQSGGIPNDIAALAGARAVTVSETPEGSRLNESLVKDLTGGDTITARFLKREFFQFRPQFKLWIRGNHKPQIRGTDDGIWRRLLLVPFVEQIPESERDADLFDKLRTELSGVLAWAVDGCLAWQREGLNPPESVRLATAAYREEMDLLGALLSECTVEVPEARTPASALYKTYRQWAEANGHTPVSNTRFGKSMSERGFLRKKEGTIHYPGIGIKENSGQLDSLDPFSSSRHFARTQLEKTGKTVQTVQLSKDDDFEEGVI